jgi:DNA-binding response OmpR family regulator
MSEKRVLVVDDDAAIRQMFRTLLVRQGYVVDAANDGSDGLKRIRAEEYDAVILDLMMPITSGFELLDILEHEKPNTMHRIIVTTGASRNDLRKLDLNRVFALIRKPFDIHELLRKVGECSEKESLVG